MPLPRSIKIVWLVILVAISAVSTGGWYVWSRLQAVETSLPVRAVEESQGLTNLVQSMYSLGIDIERTLANPTSSNTNTLIYSLDRAYTILDESGAVCQASISMADMCLEVNQVLEDLDDLVAGRRRLDALKIDFAHIRLNNITLQMQDYLQRSNRTALAALLEQTQSLERVRFGAMLVLSLVVVCLAAMLLLLYLQYLSFLRLKKTELESKRAREKAEAADRNKSEFISSVSHEIRTPLASILGFNIMIQERLEGSLFPALPRDDTAVDSAVAKIRRNMGIIVNEATRLTALINDTLDISKLDAGKLEFDLSILDPREAIRHSIEATAALIGDKPIHLRTDLPDHSLLVKADRNRLVQVLINLLSNAIKFTEQGEIVCRARARNGMVEISIKDTGMGIAPTYLNSVFDRFSQLNDPHNGKPEGTGLGLAICKEIIKRHGGTIRAESTLNVGSVFTFTLPREKAALTLAKGE